MNKFAVYLLILVFFSSVASAGATKDAYVMDIQHKLFVLQTKMNNKTISRAEKKYFKYLLKKCEQINECTPKR